MIYRTDKDFLDEDVRSIRHGFFGRKGGVSSGLYRSLNCSPGSADEPVSILQNRAVVAQAMGVPPERFLTLSQCHTALCVRAFEPWPVEQSPQADALVTDVPGLAIGVLTADCGPVLLSGEKPDRSTVIAAAHAGWQGALKGILEETVRAMVVAGAQMPTIRASIGPCIGPESYEVDLGFRQKFIDQDQDNGSFFQPGVRDGHVQFDLPAYIESRLKRAGVSRVSCGAFCDTLGDEGGCFSFRRATGRGETDYGRQASVIVIHA